MRFLAIVAFCLVFLDVAATSFVAVDASEYAYVTQFGRPVTVYDGATAAGLHWKLPWPIQSAIRLDRRLQIFDLPTPELLTHDAAGKTIDRTLSVSAYVCWANRREQKGQIVSSETSAKPNKPRPSWGRKSVAGSAP